MGQKVSRLSVQLSAQPGDWKDLQTKKLEGKLIDGRDAEIIVLATMDVVSATGTPQTASGQPEIVFRIDLADGRTVLARSTVSAFLTAMKLIEQRHGAAIVAAQQKAREAEAAKEVGDAAS
jgi:hypothetical protein